MEKILGFLEEKIMPFANKLGQQRHLLAIRDGFLSMIALTMVASIATLVNNIPIDAVKKFLTETNIGQQVYTLCQNISWGAFSFMSIFACLAIAQALWRSYGKNGYEAGLVATAVFLGISKQTVSFTPEGASETILVKGGLAASNFGATALFTAIIVALLTVELLRYLSNVKWLKIKLPDMVPPAVSRSFETMLPGILTIILSILAALILRNVTGEYLSDLIVRLIQTPIQSISDSLGSAIFIPLIICLLWSLGIHGTNVTDGIFVPVLTSLAAVNMQLAAEGATEGFHIVNLPFFYSFVWLGGAGTTLSLVIAMIIASKKSRKRYGAITSLSIAPGIFNINEPVIFGVPIVLNPILMIPFIFIPIVLSVISYLAISIGLVSPVIVQSVPWTTPPILSGFLATGDLSGALLSGFNLILAVILYIPFVIASIKIEEKKIEKELTN